MTAQATGPRPTNVVFYTGSDRGEERQRLADQLAQELKLPVTLIYAPRSSTFTVPVRSTHIIVIDTRYAAHKLSVRLRSEARQAGAKLYEVRGGSGLVARLRALLHFVEPTP